jgi:hypothetical protein
MVGVVIFIGLAILFLVAWSILAAVALLAPAPPIDQFQARSGIESDLVASVSLGDVRRAAESISGVRVANATENALLVSVSPRLGSLDRGTGAWVLITRQAAQYHFGIRAKTALNLTVSSHAVVEFERDLRMVLRKRGVVKYDFRESAATPQQPEAAPRHDPPKTSADWWES